MNEELTYQVLQSCISSGAIEFVLCAGSRNSSFVEALRLEERAITYYWPEERSAGFFALGRSKLTRRPVAIVTTSGTASVELFPATVEAFYSGIPLILITADRPEVFRGSGAPQSAEQVGLFNHYVQFCLDVSPSNPCKLDKWLKKIPVHLNVCLAEPQKQPKFQGRSLDFTYSTIPQKMSASHFNDTEEILNNFLSHVNNPLVIVSTLRPEVKESVAQFLLKLEMPAMVEAISGLREDPRLQHLCIKRTEKVLETATAADYSIDGVLRIGGVPTHRIWRDLEYCEDKVRVCALSEMHFSGLSWSRCVAEAPIDQFLNAYHPGNKFELQNARKWLDSETEFLGDLVELFEEEKKAEPSLMHELSKLIPKDAHVYLGNSLPIREWDMAAIRENRNWAIDANRGVNGIDGQISTFLGLCRQRQENWGIFGDLTTLYDMAGPWVLQQLPETPVKIVIINNGGGKLFERMYPYKEMLNEHSLSFRPLAEMWSLDYTCTNNLQDIPLKASHQLIEIIPDDAATKRFWTAYAKIDERRRTLTYAP